MGQSIRVYVIHDQTNYYPPIMMPRAIDHDASFAEDWYVIVCMEVVSLLTPAMASKNDARHDIE